MIMGTLLLAAKEYISREPRTIWSHRSIAQVAQEVRLGKKQMKTVEKHFLSLPTMNFITIIFHSLSAMNCLPFPMCRRKLCKLRASHSPFRCIFTILLYYDYFPSRMKQQSLLLSVGASSSADWAGNYIYFYLNSHSFTSLYFIATHTTVSRTVCALPRHAWTPLTPKPQVSNNSIRKQQTSLACSWWESGSTNIWISYEYNRQHWSSRSRKKKDERTRTSFTRFCFY